MKFCAMFWTNVRQRVTLPVRVPSLPPTKYAVSQDTSDVTAYNSALLAMMNSVVPLSP